MLLVPFVDLHAQYEAIRDEVTAAIQKVIESTAFVGGPFVQDFEEAFATFCGCRFAVGVSSGTSALWMTLLCLGIGQGDEVITVPSTFIATAEAISLCGATPVFVDVDERTQTMNPALLEHAITPQTKAIIPVHLFGQPADMDPIMLFAARHGLFVVEDACQAHGALYKRRPVGSIGDAACFSFYPGKNLGAYGEAGAVTTNKEELANRIAMMRDHGQSRKYFHSMVGWNGRMDGIQGAVLRVKLDHLESWNEKRRQHAATYHDLLRDLGEVRLPVEMGYARHVYHIFAIRVQNRDGLLARLNEKGISCGIHYPLPLHLQEAYRSFGIARGTFPVAEKCADELLSLPMFPELTREQIDYVAGEIETALEG